MRFIIRTLLATGALLGLVACSDRPESPLSPGSHPGSIISDGARGGNSHFFFLPPMVARPDYRGAFDATLSPVVEVCEWTSGACTLPLIAAFTTTTGPGSETIRVNPGDELYIVNFHTDQFPLDPGKIYRVRVTVAGTELGFADIAVVGSGKELKNVNSNDYIPLLDGRTLPIKFRIEAGAVFVLGPDGGTASSADGRVQLVVPPGALATEVGIVVLPVTVTGYPPGYGIIPETVYDFLPNGLVFALPAQLSIAYDPAKVPPGLPEASLTFLAEEASAWDELAGTTVDPAANTVSGPIVRFSKKADAAAAQVSVTPATAALIIGETVQLTATVTDAAGTTITRHLKWETSDAAVATVDNAGLVTTLGAGSATITATVKADKAQADATITSVPVVTVSPTSASLLIGETVQLTAAVTDVSGNPVALPVTWSSSAPAAAVVNNAGLVTGVAAGSATITALAGGVPALVMVQVSAPSPGYWTYVAPMPTARGRLTAAVANGILYAVGGYGSGRNLEAYNPATNTWTVKAQMPTTREAMTSASVNGIVYVAGGAASIYSPGLTTVEAYDPATNIWTTRAPMPTGRNYPSAAELNGLLYVVGGYTPGPTFFATLEAYDPVTNTWTTKAPMPAARSGMQVGVVNGILYAMGGYSATGYVSTAYAYDPATNSWTTLAPLPTPRSNGAVGALNGKIFIAGGNSPGCTPNGVCATVDSYDPISNSWTSKTQLSTARYANAGGVVGSLFYVTGGLDVWSTPLNSVEAYHP